VNLASLLGMLPFEFERVFFSKTNSLLSRRPSSAPFLSGDSFRAIADFVFDQTGDFDPRKVKAGSVVFLGTSRMAEFLERIVHALAAPVVLLSHQDDLNIGAEFAELADHPAIGHWFAKNALFEHPKVTPLPIGLEDRWRHNNGALADFRKFVGSNVPQIPRMAYAFTLGTNIEKRVPCYLALAKSKVAAELPQPLNASLYRRLVREYMLVASPPGNGADCHRTWEVLYMGGVPVVEDNSLHRFYRSLGLPLLLVKDWSKVSGWDERYLAAEYSALMATADKTALFMPFWVGLIERERSRISGDAPRASGKAQA